MPHGRRSRPNVYQDAYGLSVVARAANLTREKRFKKGTPKKVWQAWQDTTKQALRAEAKLRRDHLGTGTLAAAVARLLEPLPHPQKRDLGNLLNHWVTALPGAQIDQLTVDELTRVVEGWQRAGRAASTINHRRRALVALLDRVRPEAPNVARRVRRVPEPHAEARAIDVSLAEGIVNAMSDRGQRRKGEGAKGAPGDPAGPPPV